MKTYSSNNLQISPFRISISFKNKRYDLFVRHEIIGQIERFFIESKSGKKIVIQSDRPYIRQNNQKKKVSYFIKEPSLGTLIKSGSVVFGDRILDEIRNFVKSIDNDDWHLDY